MEALVTQIVFGVLLFVITGFLGYIATALSSAKGEASVLRNSMEHMARDISGIRDELKKLGNHEALIAVHGAEITNIKTDYGKEIANIKTELDLLFQTVRAAHENDKIALHRRQ